MDHLEPCPSLPLETEEFGSVERECHMEGATLTRLPHRQTAPLEDGKHWPVFREHLGFEALQARVFG